MATLIDIQNQGNEFIVNAQQIAERNINTAENNENERLNRKLIMSDTASFFIGTIGGIDNFEENADGNLLDNSEFNDLIKVQNKIIDSNILDSIISNIDVDKAYDDNNIDPIIKGVVLIHFRFSFYDKNKQIPTKKSLVFSIIDKLVKCNNTWGSSNEERDKLHKILTSLGTGQPIEDTMRYFSMSDLAVYGW